MEKIPSKVILITGAAGFIGSHLTELLLKKYRIIGIDDLSSGSRKNIQNFKDNPNFNFYYSRIQDLSNLDELISNSDVVIHLAASVGVLKTYSEPYQTLANNINCSELIIDSCYKNDKPLILASTSEVYGNQLVDEISENAKSEFDKIISIRMSYSVSKILDEMKLFLLKNSGMKSIVLRFFNVIGPNQTGRYGMVTPKFIKQAMNNEPLTIFGDGSQIRTFCDVRDIINGIEKVVEKEVFDYVIYNLGGKKEISINQLADTIIELTNSKSTKAYIPYEDIHNDFEEIFYRKPCTEKFKEMYNWENNISVEDSIKNIISTNYGT
jgi:UDP-glucose 4-epimerase